MQLKVLKLVCLHFHNIPSYRHWSINDIYIRNNRTVFFVILIIHFFLSLLPAFDLGDDWALILNQIQARRKCSEVHK